jgi:membrane associated rhomboid family serine protease
LIPLRDNIRSRRVPMVNYTLIGLNVLVFLYELSLGRGLEAFLGRYALVPASLTHALTAQPAAVPGALLTVLSAMFIHGGWLHLIFNMLYLHIFGDNVEDRLGHLRYALFYLGTGAAAAAGHVLSQPSSMLPTIGASGAVAGVMGAYLLLYPRARVLTLIPIFIIIRIVELPATAYLAIWFLLQFLQGSAELMVARGAGGVAWWAHIAGFVAGAACVLCFGLRRGRRPYKQRRARVVPIRSGHDDYPFHRRPRSS